MTSNIEAIRAAETQVTHLREQLRDLRDEARADDGVIDSEERVEIERVEAKVDTAQQMISERQQAWEANKAAFGKLWSGIAADLADVKRYDGDEFRKDQKAVTDAVGPIDKAAAAEDFATALGLAQELERLVALFLKLVENERLDGLTTKELAKVSLADDAIEEVFSEEYMAELMTMKFKGEGDPKLKDLMKEFEKGVSSSRRVEVVEDLAGIVGSPPSAAELDADYARFLVLRKQRDAIGKQGNKGKIDGVDEEKHPDFVASHEQLMFGKVLGDALGIHEVFATLLSPTGGLVGPGNELIPGVMDSPHLSPDNPVALHGTVHDAAGYLKSFHNEGPGYNYRDDQIESIVTSAIEFLPESWENDLLPLTGQISGIAYWTMEAGDEYLEARYDEGVVALEKALADARNGAADEIGELVSAVEKTKQDMSDAADEFREDMEDRAKEAEQELRDLAEKAEKEVLEARDAFEDGVDKAKTSAIEVYDEASAEARAIGGDLIEKFDAVANFIWS